VPRHDRRKEIKVAIKKIGGEIKMKRMRSKKAITVATVLCICLLIGTGQVSATEELFSPKHINGEGYAVIVGVANYYGTANDLNYPDNDAIDMKNALLSSAYGEWKEENIKVLLDSEATKDNIKDAIEIWLDTREGEGDTVLFFYSGHGVCFPESLYNPDGNDETEGYDEYLFVYQPHECTSADPCYINDAIADGELDSYLDNLESHNIVVIIDSCFSGGMTKAADLALTPKTLPAPYMAIRDGTKTLPELHVDIIDGFAEDLLSAVTKDIGQLYRVVLMACDDIEYSYETFGLQNGVFTYYVVEGLYGAADANSDLTLTAEEAFNYANPKTISYLTSWPLIVQTPQLYDNYDGELAVSQVPEFTTIAIPVAAILGLVFLFSRRKRK